MLPTPDAPQLVPGHHVEPELQLQVQDHLQQSLYQSEQVVQVPGHPGAHDSLDPVPDDGLGQVEHGINF